ncbi:DUF6481 family protein [Erythrobacter sp. sf7]|uniref:DUF6481 family protein n=1 Tax=Erythrobacter fulvus TaxID=2987523 RepID=A0ABT5JKB5_9SPHN|nr:DUF6481 family protein [Erythrobacter fulvus]MDC8753121.1 DUF6481 family protein [Erythrobacter fulvus]
MNSALRPLAPGALRALRRPNKAERATIEHESRAAPERSGRRRQMNGYNAPSFQERAAASLQAKEKALAKLKAAPQLDAAELALRAKRRVEREALAAAKAAKVRQQREEKQRLADEQRAESKAAKIKAALPKRTEAELKAARDARYAARKSRK